MPGDEIGVEMGEENVLDRQAMLVGEGEVLIDVSLRIDDGGGAILLIADEIRGVGQAGKIELFEDQGIRLRLKKRNTVGGGRSLCAASV